MEEEGKGETGADRQTNLLGKEGEKRREKSVWEEEMNGKGKSKLSPSGSLYFPSLSLESFFLLLPRSFPLLNIGERNYIFPLSSHFDILMFLL
jgi:hypothetical protein